MKKCLGSLFVMLFSMLVFAATSQANGWGEKRTLQAFQPINTITAVPTHEILSDPEGDNEFSDRENPVDVISMEGGTNGVEVTFKAVFSPKTVIGAVVGFVDIDADRNSATGLPPHANQWIPQTTQDLGVDYYLDLFDLPRTGMIELVNAQNGLTMGIFPGNIQGQTLEITFPVSIIGGHSDIFIGTIFGNVDFPTDVAPKTGHGALFGPGTVIISPSSSVMAASQNFDLTFLVYPKGSKIEKVEILLDGSDITRAILAAAVFGTIPDGLSFTARILQVNAWDHLGNGRHTLSVTIHTQDGVFSDTAEYTVIPNCETCQR